MYFNDSTKTYVGLFGFAEKGQIKNVVVADSYIQAKNYVGGICGYGLGAISNCTNAATIAGNNYIGGIVGCCSAITVSNCANTGTVSGNANVGGIVGSLVSGTVTNCSNTTVITGTSRYGSIAGENQDDIIACYYLIGTASGGVGVSWGNAYNDTTVMSKESYLSGEVAYLLNGSTSEGTLNWYQTLGTDDYPVLDNTHSTVYGTGSDYDSNGLLISTGYSNNATDSKLYQPAQADENGVYQISNKGNLMWFAGLVNGDSTIIGDTAQNLSANALLTADITLNTGVIDSNGNLASDTSSFVNWVPIGSEPNTFDGTFDGANHTINGLYFNDSTKNYVGLFGRANTNSKIKNVVVADSYMKAKNYVGGICGYTYGEINNCTSRSSIIKGNYYVGGVVGNINNGTIDTCANTSTVTGVDNGIGGIVGYSMSANVKNCSNTGSVTGTSKNASCGSICGRNYMSAITNCYYLAGTATTGVYNTSYGNNEVFEKTQAEYQSGEVTYLLNGSTSTGTLAWGQTIGTDDYPILGGAKVYKAANSSYTNVLLGDVNNSGTVDAVDSALILKLVSGIITKDSFSASYSYAMADYNQDGSVDLLDVIALEIAII